MTRQEKQILEDEAIRMDALTAFQLGQIVALNAAIERLNNIAKKSDDTNFAFTLNVVQLEMEVAELTEKVLARYTEDE